MAGWLSSGAKAKVTMFNKSSIAVLLACVIVVLVFILLLGQWRHEELEQKAPLIYLFHAVRAYEFTNGVLPETLSAALGTNSNRFLVEKRSGLTNEVRLYTGAGGWLYDKERRIIGINSPKWRTKSLFIRSIKSENETNAVAP